jgi:hypothetical protein
MEVSTPSHPRYGQHLKREELKDLIKPRAESTSTVLSWLEQSGVDARDIHNDGEWINFYTPVKRAEEMMVTVFKTYQSEARPDVKRVRSLGYSVPAEVRSHIDMIQPVCTAFSRENFATLPKNAPRGTPGFPKTSTNSPLDDPFRPDPTGTQPGAYEGGEPVLSSCRQRDMQHPSHA